MDKTAYSGSEHTSASNGSGSPNGETAGSRRLSSYSQSVAQISGVVTIIAATVYALGVFTLVLPISNSYNSTFPAAWYAVSVVPKTVVVGHGIKSLAWPSLALTVATTLFALMVLWVLYIVSIGWRQARQTASQPTLYLTTLAFIYSLLVIPIYTILPAVWPAWVRGSGLELPSPSVAFYAQRSVTFMGVPLDILIVLLCSATAGLVVARGVSYMRRSIASRAFPSMSFRGLIFKSLLIVWLSFSFLFALMRLEGYFANTSFISNELDELVTATSNERLGYLVISFLLSAFVAMLLLILSASHYILKLIKQAKRNKALPSPSAALAGLSGSGGSVHACLLRCCFIL